MRKVVFLLAVSCLFFTCGKKGCRDIDAINFDGSADRDGDCRYTKIIFYAGSDRIGGFGFKVTRIEISRRIINEEELVGTITSFAEMSPAPSGCTPTANSVEYFFNVSGSGLFTTKYYFEDGSEDNGDTFEFETSSSQECIVQNLTL